MNKEPAFFLTWATVCFADAISILLFYLYSVDGGNWPLVAMLAMITDVIYALVFVALLDIKTVSPRFIFIFNGCFALVKIILHDAYQIANQFDCSLCVKVSYVGLKYYNSTGDAGFYLQYLMALAMAYCFSKFALRH